MEANKLIKRVKNSSTDLTALLSHLYSNLGYISYSLRNILPCVKDYRQVHTSLLPSSAPLISSHEWARLTINNPRKSHCRVGYMEKYP